MNAPSIPSPPQSPSPSSSKARRFVMPIAAYLAATLLGLALLKTAGHALAIRIAVALLFGAASIATAVIVKSSVFTRPVLLAVAFIMTAAGVAVAALATHGGEVFNAGWLAWLYVWLLAIDPAAGGRWCRSASLAIGIAVVLGAVLVVVQVIPS